MQYQDRKEGEFKRLWFSNQDDSSLFERAGSDEIEVVDHPGV